MYIKSIFIKIFLFFLILCFANNLFAKIPVGKAAIVIDFDTQETLFEVNADTLNFPASLTKMMTLYIIFDYLDKYLSFFLIQLQKLVPLHLQNT